MKYPFYRLIFTTFVSLCPLLSQAGVFSFPKDPEWPLMSLSNSRLHELKTEETVFTNTQLIIRNLYRQPIITRKNEKLSITPKLISEWSQFCLLQVEPSTKTPFSFNSGFGYRLKHYKMYALSERHHINHFQPSFLMPITMRTSFHLKNWEVKTLANLEFDIDQHYISRNININQTIIKQETTFSDFIFSIHAEHSQFLAMEHDSYRSKPKINVIFIIAAEFI